MIEKSVLALQCFCFRFRLPILLALLAFTALMAVFAARLHMSAGFDKQLPQDHEYIQTFNQYRDVLFGANRIIVTVEASKGDIWNEKALTRLYDVTQALFFMKGVDRRTVTSLWTPNTRAVQITEEGMKAEDVSIGGDLPVKALTPANIAAIRDRTIVGGFIGTLGANDPSPKTSACCPATRSWNTGTSRAVSTLPPMIRLNSVPTPTPSMTASVSCLPP